MTMREAKTGAPAQERGVREPVGFSWFLAPSPLNSTETNKMKVAPVRGGKWK
jgi:hypothetical protein